MVKEEKEKEKKREKKEKNKAEEVRPDMGGRRISEFPERYSWCV